MVVEQILKKYGPSLSSVIKKVLLASGCTEQAARQRLSRAGMHIKRLPGNLFPHRESFLYLYNHEDTEWFFDNLVSALKEKNCASYHALASLAGRGGTAIIDKFRVLSGAPTMRKKQKNFDKLLFELIHSKLIFKKEIANQVKIKLNSSLFSSRIFPTIEWNNSYEILEELLTAAMENWLKKNSIGSYGKIKRNGEFNSYYWDITVPSYIYPFCKVATPIKPGFIVVDILPQYNIEPEMILYFIKKFDVTRNQYKGQAFFPILLGSSFTPKAFDLGKKSGFLITTPGNLLGGDIEKLLSDLKNTLENMAAAAQNKTEDEISSLIRSVAKIEGKSNNIRGQLFELVVAHMITNTYPGFTEVGKEVIDDDGNAAEIDVFCQEGKKAIRCFECKGNNSKQIIKLETIKRWKDRTRVVRNWIQNTELRNRELHFKFWTTSTFDADALTYLTEMKKNIKKFKIDFKSYRDVVQVAKNENFNSICNLLAEHYGI